MTNYQKYQLQWMIDHDYSLDDLMSELSGMQYEDPEDSDRIATPIDELFDEWQTDIGFGSEIWACEEEWQECEGQIEDDADEPEIEDESAASGQNEKLSAVWDGIFTKVTPYKRAEITSVWDGGVEITTGCTVDLCTHRVFDIEMFADEDDSVEVLDREYVSIDGKAYPVVRKEELTPDMMAAGYFWYE